MVVSELFLISHLLLSDELKLEGTREFERPKVGNEKYGLDESTFLIRRMKSSDSQAVGLYVHQVSQARLL